MCKRENLVEGFFEVLGDFGKTLVAELDDFSGLVPGGLRISLLEDGVKHPR